MKNRKPLFIILLALIFVAFCVTFTVFFSDKVDDKNNNPEIEQATTAEIQLEEDDLEIMPNDTLDNSDSDNDKSSGDTSKDNESDKDTVVESNTKSPDENVDNKTEDPTDNEDESSEKDDNDSVELPFVPAD